MGVAVVVVYLMTVFLLIRLSVLKFLNASVVLSNHSRESSL